MTRPERIVKLMSLSLPEFNASMARLGDAVPQADGSYTSPLPSGSVTVRYAPLSPVTLGGLLALPRANVSITFDGVDADARLAFLKHFDQTFQRGGG